MPLGVVIGTLAAVILVCIAVIALWMSRYKKCPSDKIMVIYGKVGVDKEGKPITAKCLHGGAAFIMPVIQAYAFLDLAPIGIEIALSQEEGSFRGTFAVAVSTEPGLMQCAAERLMALSRKDIAELADSILRSHVRQILFDKSAGRREIAQTIAEAAGPDLNKVGLHIVNADISEYKLI